jgi:hypothetical protein
MYASEWGHNVPGASKKLAVFKNSLQKFLLYKASHYCARIVSSGLRVGPQIYYCVWTTVGPQIYYCVWTTLGPQIYYCVRTRSILKRALKSGQKFVMARRILFWNIWIVFSYAPVFGLTKSNNMSRVFIRNVICTNMSVWRFRGR